MNQAIKQAFLPVAAMLLAAVLLLGCIGAWITGTMPPWRDSVGDLNHTEKITGEYLLRQSAAQEDTLLIFGSSELRTTEISTHPVHFFAGKRAGFQVDLIGRGSCQSLIHALQIASSGDSLQGKKVALITPPQSYVPDGIASDLFLANFSLQQFQSLLQDDALSSETKTYLASRVAELLEKYQFLPDAATVDPAVQALAEHYAGPTVFSSAKNLVLGPYHAFSRWLWDLKDKTAARPILAAGRDTAAPETMAAIDWEAEQQAAIFEAEQMTSNNEFGMLNDYYTTYIGSRLERQKGREADLSYSKSKEYNDLRALFEICREKGIEPLFIHVPLHGQWSDYTGFTADHRTEYYQNVRRIAEECGVQMLDLTGYEYDQYFMCDTMHLGWKGWLEVDKALIRYYYGG